MRGLVFAAGRGSRLRPLTDRTPKPMLDVDGRPVLTRCFETLLDLGVRDLVVVVGYLRDAIVDHYGGSFRGVPVTYVTQAERLGMAHALLAAADHARGDLALVDGDTVFDADLSPLVERHRDPDVDGTLLIDHVSPEAATRKAVCLTDGDGMLREIVNRPADPPAPAPVAAGFQTATPALVAACHEVERSTRGEYEMAAAIQRLVDRGHDIAPVAVEGWHHDVNTPADLAAARARFGSADDADGSGSAPTE